MPSRSRILIADDHTLVAELWRKLLEDEFDVVGTVGDGGNLIQAATTLKPDVILLDIVMPVLNGLDAAPRVKEVLPKVKLIFLTMISDTDLAAEAFRRGASGYLLKTCAATELILAVREVLNGKAYMSRILPKDQVDYLRRHDAQGLELEHFQKLTQKQRGILPLLVSGKAMKEISAMLNLSKSTVAFHKYRIMQTLGTKSNADLVRYAIRNHMITKM
jgi:DNA-binding NarL/FixJ family response regulator